RSPKLISQLDQAITQPCRGTFGCLKPRIELIDHKTIGHGISEPGGTLCIERCNGDGEKIGDCVLLRLVSALHRYCPLPSSDRACNIRKSELIILAADLTGGVGETHFVAA